MEEIDDDRTQRRMLADTEEDIKQLDDLISQKYKEIAQYKKDKKNKLAKAEALRNLLSSKPFQENHSYPWTLELKSKLKNVFGISSFRGLQETVINCTLSNRDCIYVAATGSGKSLVFQLPALISPGITLVVSPLLSLMEDQTNQLAQLGISSVVLNSTTNMRDFKQAASAMVDQNASLKLIYVTPEKLAKSKFFISQIEKMYKVGRFSRLVIDEVHCCSEWGHDFRKDYNSLHIFKRQYPETPIIGLTATATTQVISDIKKMLGIEGCHIFKGSFYRPNLVYEIRATSQKDNINDLVDLIKSKFDGQSGIIYCLTIKEVEDVALNLTELGVRCLAYHASLPNNERNRIQQEWYSGRCKVIAATVAFGLGINKMDVRFVIHYSISKSLENYYQETGRAGRDGKPAYCVCYFRFADIFRATTLTFRERNGKERVYQVLAFCLNRQDCRKKLLAAYFEDNLVKNPDDTDCCDNCRYSLNNRDRGMVDASDWLINLLEILNQAQQKNERMTCNKLIDAWMQVKGPAKFRLEGIPKPSLSRAECETVVGLLLCEGYLKEDFHITPYSIISYILEGSRSLMSRKGNAPRPMIPKSAFENLFQKTQAKDRLPQPAPEPRQSAYQQPVEVKKRRIEKVDYIELDTYDEHEANNRSYPIECMTID